MKILSLVESKSQKYGDNVNSGTLHQFDSGILSWDGQFYKIDSNYEEWIKDTLNNGIH